MAPSPAYSLLEQPTGARYFDDGDGDENIADDIHEGIWHEYYAGANMENNDLILPAFCGPEPDIVLLTDTCRFHRQDFLCRLERWKPYSADAALKSFTRDILQWRVPKESKLSCNQLRWNYQFEAQLFETMFRYIKSRLASIEISSGVAEEPTIATANGLIDSTMVHIKTRVPGIAVGEGIGKTISKGTLTTKTRVPGIAVDEGIGETISKGTRTTVGRRQQRKGNSDCSTAIADNSSCSQSSKTRVPGTLKSRVPGSYSSDSAAAETVRPETARSWSKYRNRNIDKHKTSNFSNVSNNISNIQNIPKKIPYKLLKKKNTLYSSDCDEETREDFLKYLKFVVSKYPVEWTKDNLEHYLTNYIETDEDKRIARGELLVESIIDTPIDSRFSYHSDPSDISRFNISEDWSLHNFSEFDNENIISDPIDELSSDDEENLNKIPENFPENSEVIVENIVAPIVRSINIAHLIYNFNAARTDVVHSHRVAGNIKIMPFIGKNIDRSISFCKDIETLEYEMDSLNSFGKKCKSHNNFGKIGKTTQTLLDEFSLNHISRNNNLLKSVLIAEKLAKQFVVISSIPIMTSFIVDTGAGIHLKCFAKGMKTHDIKQLSLMSANGPLSANKGTRVKLRSINEQECIVLENTPNVLSVGQLISQGFAFYWTPADIGIEQAAMLVTPTGEVIHLLIKNFVPYFQDDPLKINGTKGLDSEFDLVSEPDIEVDLNQDCDNISADSLAFTDQISGTKLAPVMPTIGNRIKV